MTAIILLAIGLCLAIYGLIGMKKEKGTFSNIIESEMASKNKEHREINILRKEVAESILDLQKEIFQLQDDINYIKKEGKFIPFEENNKDGNDILELSEESQRKVKEELQDSNIIESGDIKFNDKDKSHIRQLVINMLKEGKTMDEISSSLGIGRGEIILIKDLNSN